VKNLIAITELKLKAQALGIVKLDAGAKSGKIEFDTEPLVEPMILVRLVQQQPGAYKLDGANALRFNLKMDQNEARIRIIDKLLDHLAGKNS